MVLIIIALCTSLEMYEKGINQSLKELGGMKVQKIELISTENVI